MSYEFSTLADGNYFQTQASSIVLPLALIIGYTYGFILSALMHALISTQLKS